MYVKYIVLHLTLEFAQNLKNNQCETYMFNRNIYGGLVNHHY